VSHTQAQLNTRLDDAINRGELEEVKSLVEAGADFEHLDPNGWSPLISAAWVAAADIVEYLLCVGADPNYVNPAGETALSRATSIGHNQYGHDELIYILERACESDS
jgi:uncharacterized protein